ncbi:MAG: hypothetical protein WCS86_01705 [Candidatus Paceibacterota bacterium]
MKNNKGFAPIALVIAIIAVLAIGGGAYYLGTQSNYVPRYTDSNNVQPVGDQSQDNSTQSDLKIFKNSQFEFKYPSNISVSENAQVVSLSHSIPFENIDGGCDMKGDGVISKDLVDFGVSFRVSNKPLIETVKSESSYIPAENFSNGKLLVSPGYIDSSKIGSLNGYSIYEGVEGCGDTTYYFPVSDSKTLIVKKSMIQMLSGVATLESRAKVLAVPGVISSEKSEEIFNQILTSLKFVNFTQIPKQNLISDVYPLYPNLSWNTEVATATTLFGLHLSGFKVDSKNISDSQYYKFGTSFGKYYEDKLLPLGWTSSNKYQADGAGSSTWAYTKNNEYIILSYKSTEINENPNEPFTCPCSMTFLIFSGKAN